MFYNETINQILYIYAFLNKIFLNSAYNAFYPHFLLTELRILSNEQTILLVKVYTHFEKTVTTKLGFYTMN